VTISRMRRGAPFEPIDPNICVWGGVNDVINPAKFFENRPKGFGVGRPRNLAFPIDFAGRPYNTLTLPCEVWSCASWLTRNYHNEHLYSSQRTDKDRKTDMYKRD